MFFTGNSDTNFPDLPGSEGHLNSQAIDNASTSIEKIGDKFKRKLRQTLNSMDQHSSGGMPAVQRAKTNKRTGNYNRIFTDSVVLYLKFINSVYHYILLLFPIQIIRRVKVTNVRYTSKTRPVIKH